MSVAPQQRHKRSRPCMVCGGGEDDKRGNQRRCHGFISSDGKYEHCSREDLAGMLEAESSGLTYAHRVDGSCKCGLVHAEEPAFASAVVERMPDIHYDYTNPAGVFVFQVIRRPDKTFRQRRPDGAGGWIWKTTGIERWPYRAAELAKLEPGATVYIVEGEKDVDTLMARGFNATCNSQGAGKWGLTHELALPLLADKRVVIIADNDQVGRDHALDVACALDGEVAGLRAVAPPYHVKDVTEWVETGATFDENALCPIVFPEEPAEEVAPPVAEKPKPLGATLAPELPFPELWTPEPEDKLLIPELGLVPGPPHLVTGSWYTGKTLMLMSMGLAVASGRSLFDRFKVRRGRWIHFDHEMGRRALKRYLQRLARGMGIDPSELEGHLSMRVLPVLNLVTKDAVNIYRDILADYDFCTVDPLRSATPGQDENKSEFRQWLDILAVASDRSGCVVNILHHDGKPVMGKERRNTGRGSSSIDDAVQSKFVMTSEGKDEPIKVSHEKTRALDKPVDDFWLKIASGPEWVRLDHHDDESLKALESGAKEAKQAGLLNRARGNIFVFFEKHAGQLVAANRKDALGRIGGDRNVHSTAFTQLLHEGRIVQSVERGQHVYKLNSNVRDMRYAGV